MAKVEELKAEIEARGGELPSEGSGENGAVVKSDLEAVLAELPEQDEDAPEDEDSEETKSMNGNTVITH